jgi:putative tryptophan/tyrosine transport system substrate-binding protein
MRRREFITFIGRAGFWPLFAAWSTLARAQQTASVRRVGVSMDTTEDNPDAKARFIAFRQTLHQLGWTEEGNIHIDVRWSGGNAERAGANAKELVGLAPDVIFTFGHAQLAPLARETRTIPIVFVGASDPVGGGYAASFAHPGGNMTGFPLYEASIVGKWITFLKEIAPAIKRVTILVDPDTAVVGGRMYAREFETAAKEMALEPITANARGAKDIEAAITAMTQNDGMIVVPDTFSNAHRPLIVELTNRHSVPAIYGLRQFPSVGGLISYGPDTVEICRRAASYVDRILRGQRPGELPLELPVKWDLVINVRAAKSIGLTVPQSLLLEADEVIE